MRLSNGWTATAARWSSVRVERSRPAVGAPGAIRSQPPCGAVGDEDEVMDTGVVWRVLLLLRALVCSYPASGGARRGDCPGNSRAAATTGGPYRAVSGRLGCADPRPLHLSDRNRGS